jgi:hypothetical protein
VPDTQREVAETVFNRNQRREAEINEALKRRGALRQTWQSSIVDAARCRGHLFRCAELFAFEAQQRHDLCVLFSGAVVGHHAQAQIQDRSAFVSRTASERAGRTVYRREKIAKARRSI